MSRVNYIYDPTKVPDYGQCWMCGETVGSFMPILDDPVPMLCSECVSNFSNYLRGSDNTDKVVFDFNSVTVHFGFVSNSS